MRTWRRDPEVDPASVGIDPAALDAAAAVFEKATDAGDLYHGAQMAVYRDGKRVLEMGGGLARVRTQVPVEPETTFVIYSSTKGVAALVMLMLYERGKFHYDEPVVKYWPEFASQHPDKAQVTIRHVMSHRAGIPIGPAWLTAKYHGDVDARRRAMEELPLAWIPGEKNGYHPQNFGHLTDELCRRIDGRDLGAFAREEIFEPLGIDDFWIGLPADPELEARVAWCYNKLEESLGPEATGQVDSDVLASMSERQSHTESFEPDPEHPERIPEETHPFNRPATWRAVLPASGGIATARALAHFYAPLALGGKMDDVRLVHREYLDHATTPTNRRQDADATIGFKMRWGTGWHMGLYGGGSTLRTFGHGGAGGQVGFADPDRRLSMAFLCNGQRKSEYLLWRFKLQGQVLQACRD
jgi:CubicO group peptidase (beta-lactamase class C family)